MEVKTNIAKERYDEGIKAQINEEELKLHIKRNDILEKRVKELDGMIKELVDNSERWHNSNEELRLRAESFKAQLVVYRRLYENVIDKLIKKDNE